MQTLVICNDPPYGTERSWNGLRLTGCAVAGQKVPDGNYHLDRMIGSAERHGADIACCGTCLDARGITDQMQVKAARRARLDELKRWTLWADKVITF